MARRPRGVGSKLIAAKSTRRPAARPRLRGAPPTGANGTRATHVLALGWEPAFCLGHEDKAECANETAQSFDASHLSLHGLWPQPRGKAYCNVSQDLVRADHDHDWASLPEPDLTDATKARLAAVMPGFQSGLERHEWIVHGTCFGATPDSYFNRAADLVEQVNASAVRDLFTQNVRRIAVVGRDSGRVR